jgi:hypothetical protein
MSTMTETQRIQLRENKKKRIIEIVSIIKTLSDIQQAELLSGQLIENISNQQLSERNNLFLRIQAKERNLELSCVGGYKQWNEVNRQVKAGEKGFLIIIPMKQKDKQEPFFGGKYVFDISQTEEMPEDNNNNSASVNHELVSADVPEDNNDDLPF